MSINCKSNATNWKSNNTKASLVHIFTAVSKKLMVAGGEGKWRINRKIGFLSVWFAVSEKMKSIWSNFCTFQQITSYHHHCTRNFFPYQKLGLKNRRLCNRVATSLRHFTRVIRLNGTLRFAREAIVCTYDAAKLHHVGIIAFRLVSVCDIFRRVEKWIEK